jgi:hypothetical protein
LAAAFLFIPGNPAKPVQSPAVAQEESGESWASQQWNSVETSGTESESKEAPGSNLLALLDVD